MHEIEGVEAGARLTGVTHKTIEVGQALRAVRHGLAVDHDPPKRQILNGRRDGEKVQAPVAARCATRAALDRRPLGP